MLLHKARVDDGSVLLLGKSTTHDKCPDQSKGKAIRAHVFIGGWLLQPIDSTHTRVTFVGSTDLRGSLPSIIKAQLERRQPGLVAAVRPVIEKRVAEISQIADAQQREATERAIKQLVDELPIYTKQQLDDARLADKKRE